MIKVYYDNIYKALYIFKKSKVYLRLYHEYKIFDLSNYKLYN